MATEHQDKRAAAKQRLNAYIKASRNRLNNKTANLRRIAAEEPHQVGKALDELSRLFSDISEVFKGLAGDASALKENLDLAEPGKTASIRMRVQARRNYAKTLRQVANETPEELGAALNEIYRDLDEAVSGIEAMSERFGLPLGDATDELGEEVKADVDADAAPIEEPVDAAPAETSIDDPAA